MSSTQRHPHIESATEEQLLELLKSQSPVVRQIYLDVHRLVLKTLPGVVYSTDCKDGATGYGAHQYGYNGWGICALAAHAKWVRLAFLHGAALDDPAGLLEGTAAKMRHIKLRSPEEAEQRREAIVALLNSAARLHTRG